MRKKSKQIVLSYNPDLKFITSNKKLVLEITQNFGIETQKYKFMNDTLKKKSKEVFRRIEHIGHKIAQFNNISEINRLDEYYGTPLFYIGRILVESQTGEGQLNPKSILFETYDQNEKSIVVKLNIEKMNTYSLFPGQIVCVKGINKSLKELDVFEIFDVN
jgi:DNA polymerase alpha subunit B